MDQLKNFDLNNIDLNNIDLRNIDLSKLQVNTKGYDNVELSPEHEEMIRKVGLLIDDARTSKLLSCDEECRKNQKEQLLYNDYLQAKQTAENAPRVLEETERNFYEFSKGTTAYTKMREGELKKDAETKANSIAKQYMGQLVGVLELYKQYNTQNDYLSQVNNSVSLYHTNIKEIQDDISKSENKTELNNRMNYYTLQKEDFLSWVSSIINKIYYILAIAYGVTFIILNKKFTNFKLWGTLVWLLLFPTLFSYVFSKIKTDT